MFYRRWKPHVPVAVRRLRAAREMARLKKKGRLLSPVAIEGRKIAVTFWGKAWCDNLEHYSDYANRLPRGRTYVRNGSVLDLQIGPRQVNALVSGSRIYKVTVKVTPVPKARWRAIRSDCASGIDSLVELLAGRFSTSVMERICRDGTGLFPSLHEIAFSCSCPDWASMCKHVAAVLYGIGARLDEAPELLFKLRVVNEAELIAHAGKGLSLTKKKPAAEKILDSGDLGELFGLELADVAQSAGEAVGKRAKRKVTKAPPGKKKAARRTKRRASASKKKRRARLLPAMLLSAWALALPEGHGSSSAACPPPGYDRAALAELESREFRLDDRDAREQLALALVPCLAARDPALRDGVAFEALALRHGVAHAADLLLQLALNPALDRVQLDRILAAVAAKVAPSGEHFYIYGKPARLDDRRPHDALRVSHGTTTEPRDGARLFP